MLPDRIIGGCLSLAAFIIGAANTAEHAPWYQSWTPMIVALTGLGTLLYSVYRDLRRDRREDDRERRSRRRRK